MTKTLGGKKRQVRNFNDVLYNFEVDVRAMRIIINSELDSISDKVCSCSGAPVDDDDYYENECECGYYDDKWNSLKALDEDIADFQSVLNSHKEVIGR